MELTVFDSSFEFSSPTPHLSPFKDLPTRRRSLRGQQHEKTTSFCQVNSVSFVGCRPCWLVSHRYLANSLRIGSRRGLEERESKSAKVKNSESDRGGASFALAWGVLAGY